MTIRYDVNFHVARSSSQSPSQYVFLIDFVFIEPKILRSKYLTASQIGVTFLLGYYQVQQTRNSSNLWQHVLLPLEEKNSLKYNLHVSQFVFRFCILWLLLSNIFYAFTTAAVSDRCFQPSNLWLQMSQKLPGGIVVARSTWVHICWRRVRS